MTAPRRSFLCSALLPVVAGGAQAVSIAAPWNGQALWWLQCLSLALLVALLEHPRSVDSPRAPHGKSTWRRALLQGWLFASTWLCGSFWWLYVSMHTYGGLPALMAAAATFALPAALAMYYAIACALYARLAPASPVGRVLLFSALWTLAELVRGRWFTGFPWAAGGYAHVDGPLVMWAPVVGVYGVGAIAAAVAATLTILARHFIASRRKPRAERRWGPWLALAGLVGFLGWNASASLCLTQQCASPSAADSSSTGWIDVALLQGNIPQDEKFIPGGGIETALRWYGQQLQQARASLVVTPETALPLLPSSLPEGYLQAVVARYAQGAQAAVVGLPLGDKGGYSNSVLGFSSASQAPYRYDKQHLVPFGEFVPSMFRWFTRAMNIPLGDFRRGALPQAPFLWHGQRIAPNICYEDLFGDEIGASFKSDAESPTVLLNVSNIAWFGDTVAIDQHLAISRMRAIEFSRPMLRATNTGATVVIDHRGRVTASLPRLTRGVLEARVEGRTSRTVYARWVSHWGLWPLWGVCLLVVGWAWLRRSWSTASVDSPGVGK